VQRLDPHALHQRADTLAANGGAGSIELISQHACPHERVFQMQFIDTPHQRQISGTDGFLPVVDTAPAYTG